MASPNLTRLVFTQPGTFFVPAGVKQVTVISEREVEQTPMTQRADGVQNKIGPSGGAMSMIDSNGNLYNWGINLNGDQGTNDTINKSSPTLVTANLRALEVIVGNGTPSMVLGYDGVLYATGLNNQAQLGTGTLTNTPVHIPVQIPTRTHKVFTGVSLANDDYQRPSGIFVQDTLGQMWSWGQNNYGQLGNGLLQPFPIYASFPTMVIGLQNNIAKVYPQTLTTFFLTTSGQIAATGWNNYGMLGANINPSVTSAVSSPVYVTSSATFKEMYIGPSGQSIYATDTQDRLWAWGNNIYGQLGLGDAVSRSTPTLVSSTLKVKRFLSDQFGWNCALLTDTGALYTWGRNEYGQCAQNTTLSISSPTLVAGTYANLWGDGSRYFFYSNSNVLTAVGFNSGGELGVNDAISRSTPTLVVGNMTQFGQIATMKMQFNVIFCMMTDGLVYAWGRNSGNSILGMAGTNQSVFNTSSPIAITGTQRFQAIWPNQLSNSGGAMFGLATDGRLFAWGANVVSGTGDTLNRSTPTLVSGFKMPDIRGQTPERRLVDVVPGTPYSVTPGGNTIINGKAVGYMANKITIEFQA